MVLCVHKIHHKLYNASQNKQRHLLLIVDEVVNELHRGFLHLGPDLGTVCIFNITGDLRCIHLQISTSAGLCVI